ncbi:MAG: thiamine pyrophosphate-binding protein, partial [Chromatiales bacterium]|nr:thiamine pyrophosphate-binding protein [Chromatiales bacterium]
NMTQESRQIDILAPACKELIRVEMIERLPELTRRAFAVATSGRPGPVVLDVPEDIAHGTFPFDAAELVADPRHQQIPAHRIRPSADALAEAVSALRSARRPIVLAGGGVHLSDACEVLQAFAQELNIPVAHTMTGKGAIACSHPLSAGLFGRYDRIANDLIAQSDCLLVVGCKLGEIATRRFTLIPDSVPLIHVEMVAEEMGRTTPATVPVWADVREGVRDLHEALSPTAAEQRADRQSWVDGVASKMAVWSEEVRGRLESNEVPVNMARMLNELNLRMPEDGLLVADGGFAAHWGGLLFNTKRAGRGFIPDRGFASIGYGLPGTMGARLAAPDAPVMGITGDGGFNMVLGELETARRMKLGFGLIVVNNAASGYVKALQHLMYGEGNYQSSDLAESNYADVANALGCEGIRVEHPDQLTAAIDRGLAARDVPVIIDVVVTRNPADMLPGVDNRTVTVKKGDRVA